MKKTIIDKTMVSIGIAGNGVFCHFDVRRTRRLALANLIEASLRMLKSDVSPEESRGQHDNERGLTQFQISNFKSPHLTLS